MRRAALLVPLAAVLALTGCSQIAALAPVGGSDVAEARFATIDVLVAAGIDVQEAPTCHLHADGTSITCRGTAAGGETITATSTSAADTSLTVKVGSDVIYSGSQLAVLEAGSR